MTETKAELGQCLMGASTERPCPYPAAVEIPHRFGSDVGLCLFHAATEPLYAEADELAMSLEMLGAYLKGARKAGYESLVTVQKRARVDFTQRKELIEEALDDLAEAEEKLYRF